MIRDTRRHDARLCMLITTALAIAAVLVILLVLRDMVVGLQHFGDTLQQGPQQ